jgi:hypothetical protein
MPNQTPDRTAYPPRSSGAGRLIEPTLLCHARLHFAGGRSACRYAEQASTIPAIAAIEFLVRKRVRTIYDAVASSIVQWAAACSRPVRAQERSDNDSNLA